MRFPVKPLRLQYASRFEVTRICKSLNYCHLTPFWAVNEVPRWLNCKNVHEVYYHCAAVRFMGYVIVKEYFTGIIRR